RDDEGIERRGRQALSDYCRLADVRRRVHGRGPRLDSLRHQTPARTTAADSTAGDSRTTDSTTIGGGTAAVGIRVGTAALATGAQTRAAPHEFGRLARTC